MIYLSNWTEQLAVRRFSNNKDVPFQFSFFFFFVYYVPKINKRKMPRTYLYIIFSYIVVINPSKQTFFPNNN